MNNFDKILLKKSDHSDRLVEMKGIEDEYENPFDLKNIFLKRGQLSMYSAAEANPKYGPWESGPMKMMNGNVYSLFVLVYVGVISLIVYIAFNFKAPERTPPAPGHKKIPIITCTCMYHQIEKQRAEEEVFKIGCRGMKKFENHINKSNYDSIYPINLLRPEIYEWVRKSSVI